MIMGTLEWECVCVYEMLYSLYPLLKMFPLPLYLYTVYMFFSYFLVQTYKKVQCNCNTHSIIV